MMFRLKGTFKAFYDSMKLYPRSLNGDKVENLPRPKQYNTFSPSSLNSFQRATEQALAQYKMKQGERRMMQGKSRTTDSPLLFQQIDSSPSPM